MSKNTISLSEAFFRPWSDELQEAPEKIAAPTGSMLVLKGPQDKIGRTQLKLSVGDDCARGQVRTATGASQGTYYPVFGLEKVVSMRAGELALPFPDGSCIVGKDGELSLVTSGSKAIQLPAKGYGFLAAAGVDQFWTASQDLKQALLMDVSGEQLASFSCQIRGSMVTDSDGNLCSYGKQEGKAAGLHCLGKDGEWKLQEGYTMKTFDRLLGIGDQQIITTAPGGISVQARGKKARKISILSAGRSEAATPFVSGYKEGVVSLQLGNEKQQELAVEETYRANLRPYYVVAVNADRILVRGDEWLLEYDLDGKMVKASALDDAIYTSTLFPQMWELRDMLAMGGETLLLSCSGPTGISVLKIDF